MTLDPKLASEYAKQPAFFREHVEIDTDAGRVRCGQVMDGWQRQDLLGIDPGIMQAVGRIPYDSDTPNRAYLERPRGHSKTSDLAIVATWALLFAARPIRMAAAAADKDQSRLLRDSIERLTLCNPQLAKVLDVQAYRVTNRTTGATLDILAADSHSSYGLLLDVLFIDELANWPTTAEPFWIALASTTAKRRHCFTAIISNAGFDMGTGWQWAARETFRENPKCYFSRLDGPAASWIGEDMLAEQERLLPREAFRRLWLNEWTTGSGDAIAVEDIDRAFAAGLDPMNGRESGFSFVAGLDLSSSKDFSAFVVVGKHSTGRYRVADVRLWRPHGRKIDQGAIEYSILEANRRFRLRKIGADPFQADYLIGRLKKQQVPIEARPQQGKQLVEQCFALVEQFNSSNIDAFHDQLEYDLRNLRVEEKSYGARLSSPRGPQGHGDVATALSIALAVGKAMYVSPRSFSGDDVIGPSTTSAGRLIGRHPGPRIGTTVNGRPL